MLRSTLLLVLFSGAFQATAQLHVRLAPVVGVNLFNNKTINSNVRSEDGYNESSYSYLRYQKEDQKALAVLKQGFQAGVLVDLGFGKKNELHLHTGALFEQISGTNNYSYHAYSFEAAHWSSYYIETVNLRYISVPLFLTLTPKIGPGKLNIFMGPQFSLAIGGTYKANVGHNVSVVWLTSLNDTSYTSTEEGSISVGSPAKDENRLNYNTNEIEAKKYYNPFNVSLNIGVGYEYKSVLFRMYYSHGITNTEKNYFSDTKYKVYYHGFNFSLAYFIFGNKKG